MKSAAVSAAAVALAATAILAPSVALAAPAHSAPVLAHDGAHGCAITSGDLTWGVKESFRSYISGSIANGGWEVSDGANYSTPLFSWSNPTGEIDAESGEGAVSFLGTIHFTGHGGVLDLTLSNPTIELAGDGTARMLMDARSNSVQGELVVDEEQIYIGKIEGIAASDPSSGAFSFTDAPMILTSEGASAFGEMYSSGDALDPVNLTLQMGDCAGDAGVADPGASEPGAEADAPAEEPVATTPISAEPGVPWVPIVIGGVAIVVILVAASMLIAGRKKHAPAPTSAPRDEGQHPAE